MTNATPGHLLLVFLGGGLGSALRFAVALALARPEPHLPWGTLAVNLAGSAALGLVAGLLAGQQGPALLFLGVGVLGGFTTYSTFNLELLRQVEAGALGRAAAYVGATLAGGLALGALGLWLGRALARTG